MITVHDIFKLLCSVYVVHSGPRRRSIDPAGRSAPTRDVMHTVRYGVVPTLRRDSQNLR